MTQSILDMVREFHEVSGAPVRDTPQHIRPTEEFLRIDLIEEELEELKRAVDKRDLVSIADALGDLLYVVYGGALAWGIPIEDVVREIHRSNMTKFPDGKVTLREDGKILKPETYEPPDLKPLLG